MSIRVKFAALYGLLFALMTLLLSYSVKNGEVNREPIKGVDIILTVSTLLAAAVILIVLMSWRDIPHKRIINEEIGLGYLVALAAMLGSVLFALYRIAGLNVRKPPANLNNTSGGVVAPVPPLYKGTGANFTTFTNSTSTHSIHQDYLLLYGAFAVFVAGLVYFAVLYYRYALKKRERKEMRKRAELFDRKVEELGLEMFSDPREAVVGIYKNTVLWFEVLGLPYKESWTHWEHVRNVTVFRESFTGLTRLFEKARYAPEKVTWEDAERALELYRRMRGALNEAE